MHLNEKIFEKFIFEKLLKAKSLFSPNQTITINKFQGSRLAFDLSAKVAHIGVPSNNNIVFSETTGPNELKFHIETP